MDNDRYGNPTKWVRGRDVKRALLTTKPGLSRAVVQWAIVFATMLAASFILYYTLGIGGVVIAWLCFIFGVFSCGCIISEVGRKDGVVQ